MKKILFVVTLWSLLLVFQMGNAKTVLESAREIPIAYNADVIVVGGSAAGVAAAVEAAHNGASVFLAAPRPYLGEDLCAPYRLWLNDGENPDTPLTEALFSEPVSAGPEPVPGYTFRYETDLPSDAVHKDTQPPSRLNDGKWRNAPNQSVQYAGDVTIIADLGKEQSLNTVHVMAYQRTDDFAVNEVTVLVSDDQKEWKEIATGKNEWITQGEFEDKAIDIAIKVQQETRYVKLQVKKTNTANRILLGEIVLSSGEPEKAAKPAHRNPPTPMQIKTVLDKALLDAKVTFLYSCYATDILRDSEGKIAGIVMVNRSGRQAVLGKVIIDAMPRAEITRMAGTPFSPYPAGPQKFQRVVIGGEAESSESIRELPSKVQTPTNEFAAYEYSLTIPMKDGSFASFAEADQIARDKTWRKGQVDASETLFQVPPDSMKGRAQISGNWPGVDQADLNAFRPESVEHIYVLNGCADVSREAAETLLRPLNLIAMGTRLGKVAAQEASTLSAPKNVKLTGDKTADITGGEIRELLTGVRPVTENAPTLPSEERAIPVLGEYDVVVIGGGTGGAPAGISAARQGAKTLVVEYLHGLGGVGTLGLIGNYYFGYREGFTQEIDEGVAKLSGNPNPKSTGWDVESKMEWYRSELRKAGAELWFGALGCGAYVVDGKVKGVVVATPEGRGVILAKVTIDSTGSADIAISAGSPYEFTGGDNAALQGTGLPPRQPGASYTNTDYTFVDDSDPVDVWRAFVIAKEKFAGAYDLGQIVDSRERRRIVGDFVISPLDIMNERTYPDTVNIAYSNFDTHGFTVHPAFLLRAPGKKGIYANTPYRALLPKGLDGILVTGLGISAHRDAMPILRMQACIQNQGYAVGIAASMAAKENKGTRDINLHVLQEALVKKGNLPERVLTDSDSFPIPEDKIADAVKSAAKNYEGLDVLLTNPQEALPMLRDAYRNVADTAGQLEDSTRDRLAQNQETETIQNPKLIYAHIMGILGDPAGADTLIKAVKERQWDQGWRFTGMGQFGGSLSALDSLIIALGRTRDSRALPVILEKAAQLDSTREFSHHRAIAMALESLGDPNAAKPLADLLKKPGMSGFAYTDIDAALKEGGKNDVNDNSTREETLRELVLARALYRCGDYEGLGEKILRQYEHDLRGHLARHAQAVLNEK